MMPCATQSPNQERRELLSRMTNDAFKDIEKLEADLWEAADNLRANSKLTSSDYFMPVLGVIFLRHAANRFDAGPPADRGRPGQRQDAEAQGPAGRLHRAPLALPAGEGPLRLDHAAGRRQRRRPAQARHRRHDRHRGRVRAARWASCRRTTASSRPRCSKT